MMGEREETYRGFRQGFERLRRRFIRLERCPSGACPAAGWFAVRRRQPDKAFERSKDLSSFRVPIKMMFQHEDVKERKRYETHSG